MRISITKDIRKIDKKKRIENTTIEIDKESIELVCKALGKFSDQVFHTINHAISMTDLWAIISDALGLGG